MPVRQSVEEFRLELNQVFAPRIQAALASLDASGLSLDPDKRKPGSSGAKELGQQLDEVFAPRIEAARARIYAAGRDHE